LSHEVWEIKDKAVGGLQGFSSGYRGHGKPPYPVLSVHGHTPKSGLLYFLASTSQRFTDLISKDRSLLLALDIYHHSKHQNVIELEFLIGAVALEKILTVAGIEVPTPDKKTREAIQEVALNAIRESGFDSVIEARVRESLHAMGYPALRQRLEEAIVQLGLDWPSSVAVKDIIGARNDIVHRGAFRPEYAARAWDLITATWHLIDQIVLRLLHYDGVYLDCTRRGTPASLWPGEDDAQPLGDVRSKH
jgi:hypothetical protein